MPPPGLRGPFEPGLVVEQFSFDSTDNKTVAIDLTAHHWGTFLPQLAIKWMGVLHIGQAGAYSFKLTSLGASELRLDGVRVLQVHSKGDRNATSMSGRLDVQAGHHPLVLLYYEQVGRAGLIFEYLGPDTGGMMRVVPPGALWHQRGPCSLTGLRNVQQPPCGGRRWALADGESCSVHCGRGWFSSVSGEASQVLRCADGALEPALFACEEKPCAAPQVEGAASPSCRGGAFVRSGGTCNPVCRPGFAAVAPHAPACRNGSLDGAFACHHRRPCTPPAAVPHGANGPDGLPAYCGGGGSVPHGAACVARCEPNYRPTRNLTCNDGQLLPEPVFECVSVTTTPPAVPLLAGPAVTTTTAGSLLGMPPMPDLMLGWGPTLSRWLWPLLALAMLCLVACICCLCRRGRGKRKKREVLLSDSERSHLTKSFDSESDGGESGSAPEDSCDASPGSGSSYEIRGPSIESESDAAGPLLAAEGEARALAGQLPFEGHLPFEGVEAALGGAAHRAEPPAVPQHFEPPGDVRWPSGASFREADATGLPPPSSQRPSPAPSFACPSFGPDPGGVPANAALTPGLQAASAPAASVRGSAPATPGVSFAAESAAAGGVRHGAMQLALAELAPAPAAAAVVPSAAPPPAAPAARERLLGSSHQRLAAPRSAAAAGRGPPEGTRPSWSDVRTGPARPCPAWSDVRVEE